MLNSMHMSNFYEPAMKCSWGFLYTILFLTICRGISRHFIFAMLSQIFSYFCSCYDLRIHSCFHMPYSYSPWFFPFTFSPIDCTIWNFLLLDLKYLNNVTVMSFCIYVTFNVFDGFMFLFRYFYIQILMKTMHDRWFFIWCTCLLIWV